MSWRIRYRADAGGFVAQWAGQWASGLFTTRENAERVRSSCVNAEHMETVEVSD